MIDPRVRVALEAVLGGAIASAHESDVLEFKTVGRSLDDAVVDLSEASACFANAAGGSVVVGVQDHEPGPAAFVGSPWIPCAPSAGSTGSPTPTSSSRSRTSTWPA